MSAACSPRNVPCQPIQPCQACKHFQLSYFVTVAFSLYTCAHSLFNTAFMVRSLPPPIHDPTSGKTFVAIPAPPFVFAENATYTTSDTPSRRTKASDFVYVEQRTPIDNRRMFTAARYETPKEKRSVNKWTVRYLLRLPYAKSWLTCIGRVNTALSKHPLDTFRGRDTCPMSLLQHRWNRCR